jgi:hypothetical protein
MRQKLKPRGKPFGAPGHKGGRPRGALNRATTEIKEAARLLLEDEGYQTALKARLLSGTAGAVEPLLYHYAFGKPRETLKHEGLQPAQLVVTNIANAQDMQAIVGTIDHEAGPDDEGED